MLCGRKHQRILGVACNDSLFFYQKKNISGHLSEGGKNLFRYPKMFSLSKFLFKKRSKFTTLCCPLFYIKRKDKFCQLKILGNKNGALMSQGPCLAI